jgi:hypothetical protein
LGTLSADAISALPLAKPETTAKTEESTREVSGVGRGEVGEVWDSPRSLLVVSASIVQLIQEEPRPGLVRTTDFHVRLVNLYAPALHTLTTAAMFKEIVNSQLGELRVHSDQLWITDTQHRSAIYV